MQDNQDPMNIDLQVTQRTLRIVLAAVAFVTLAAGALAHSAPLALTGGFLLAVWTVLEQANATKQRQRQARIRARQRRPDR